MNLHLKLFIPVFLLLVVVSLTTHYYWFSDYLAIETETQKEQEHSFVDFLGTALTADLLNNDFAKTNTTLDSVLNKREHWHAITLYDSDRNKIYPLIPAEPPKDIKLDTLEHAIIFDGKPIAHLIASIDITALSANRIDHINYLEKLLLFTLLLAAILSTMLQDQLIRRPLRRLAAFANDIAHGKYDSAMEYRSRDIIGNLVIAFNTMRNQIKQREAELIESQQRNEAVIENAVDGIISIGARGEIISFNPAAENIFGYKHSEVAGENVKKLMPQPYKREHDGYLYNYLTTGKKKIIGIGREVKGLRKDGTTFPLELAVSEINLADKRMFIGITRDITERKKIEKMKTEFVSTVSHELRTPLTSIRGALGLVLGKSSDSLSPKIRRMLETANRNSERLTFLINDILDLEKLEAGKLDFVLEYLNLKELVKRAIDDNEGYAQSHKVDLNMVYEADTNTTVYVDKQRLLQVFANLISNAIKYSPENEKVEISVKTKNGFVRISVIDNGPGIPDEFRTRIFGRFAQADSSDTREKGGTGLGLTITKAIIDQLGGIIDYHSVQGHGAEFYIELPMVEESIENFSVDESLPKVLICEDDPDVAYVLANLLEHEGLSGDIAATAENAYELLKNNHYSLLLLDLVLPDANGLELVRELRKNEDTRALPIIIVSGRANEGRKEFNGDAVTVANWLQKPIDRDRLSQAIADAISDSKRPRILHVEDSLDVIQVSRALLEEDSDFDYATSLAESKHKLANNQYDLIIIDVSLPDGSGLDLLELIDPECPVVLFSGQETDADIKEQVAATLTKSRTTNNELIQTVKRLLIKSKQK